MFCWHVSEDPRLIILSVNFNIFNHGAAFTPTRATLLENVFHIDSFIALSTSDAGHISSYFQITTIVMHAAKK
jgi:hypothetical protein